MKRIRNTSAALALAAVALAAPSAARAALFIGPSDNDVFLATFGVDNTPLSGGDLDDGYWDVGAAPAGFTFFGATPGNVFVGTNGYLSFGSGATVAAAQALPNTAFAGIAGFWADLNTSVDPYGDIRYSNENGVLKVDYLQNRLAGGYGDATFEVALFGSGNGYGFAPGTVMLSYGAINLTDPNQRVALGLNAGDGVRSFFPGASGGVLTGVGAQSLSGSPGYRFSPDGSGGYRLVSSVPESGAASLLLLGGAGAWLAACRRQSQKR